MENLIDILIKLPQNSFFVSITARSKLKSQSRDPKLDIFIALAFFIPVNVHILKNIYLAAGYHTHQDNELPLNDSLAMPKIIINFSIFFFSSLDFRFSLSGEVFRSFF